MTWNPAPRQAGRRVETWIGNLGFMLVGGVSRDVTEQISASRLLVLAPHPDDETLACGGCIARLVGLGGPVALAVATDGSYGNHHVHPAELGRVRRAELVSAVSGLGLDPRQVTWLGFDDGELGSEVDRLAEQVGDLVTSFRPTIVLSPWAHDTHPDHAALGRAARIATAYSSVALLEYVVWAWTNPLHLLRDSFRQRPRGTGPGGRAPGRTVPRRPVCVRTGGYLGAKVSALSAHRSQLGPSASELGLPAGDGPLSAKFLRHFTGPAELFIPFGSGLPRPGRPTSARTPRSSGA